MGNLTSLKKAAAVLLTSVTLMSAAAALPTKTIMTVLVFAVSVITLAAEYAA